MLLILNIVSRQSMLATSFHVRNLEEMTAQGTLKFLRIKWNLLLLVRNETLFMKTLFINPIMKPFIKKANMFYDTRMTKSMTSKDCCFLNLGLYFKTNLAKVMQVERDRTGVQSRSFHHLCPCPQFLLSNSCYNRSRRFWEVWTYLVKGVYSWNIVLERINRLFGSTLKFSLH